MRLGWVEEERLREQTSMNLAHGDLNWSNVILRVQVKDVYTKPRLQPEWSMITPWNTFCGYVNSTKKACLQNGCILIAKDQVIRCLLRCSTNDTTYLGNHSFSFHSRHTDKSTGKDNGFTKERVSLSLQYTGSLFAVAPSAHLVPVSSCTQYWASRT